MQSGRAGLRGLARPLCGFWGMAEGFAGFCEDSFCAGVWGMEQIPCGDGIESMRGWNKFHPCMDSCAMLQAEDLWGLQPLRKRLL